MKRLLSIGRWAIGNIMAGIGTPDYWGNYFRRIIDADGLLRLVSLQVRIRAEQVGEADVPAFLSGAGPEFRDPYTGQAMLWSKERGIHFRGHSDRLPDSAGWVSLRP